MQEIPFILLSLSTTKCLLSSKAFKQGSKNSLLPLMPAKAAYCEIDDGLEVD